MNVDGPNPFAFDVTQRQPRKRKPKSYTVSYPPRNAKGFIRRKNRLRAKRYPVYVGNTTRSQEFAQWLR